MSFILDALRKSDQQRQRSAAPTLASAQAPVAEPRQPALLWYGLIAAVLVGAGILIGWLQQTPPQALPAALPPTLARPVEAPSFTPAPRPAFPETARKPDAPPPTAAAQVPTSAPPPTPLPVAVASTAVAAPASASAADATRDSAVLQLAELPPAVQQEIPKLSILAHSYSSKPKARFVFINDQMMHEEDYPAPGLKLEQITPDGMVFNYKGYRFRRAANSDIR